MNPIAVLDQKTIDQIAAGEVVERPASVVKELTENAIDAQATAVTVDIQDGGITQIRITDDGKGIPREEIPLAFLRHATSKIRDFRDLQEISSLGFRGEALSSIAAVSRVEMITKQAEDLTASRYRIDGGQEMGMEEIGAPDGTTIIVRSLFYNTPARAKFLKTPMTEASHVGSYVEQLALSNPGIAFKYLVNGDLRIDTGGNGSLKDVIYRIYGRELTSQLIPVDGEDPETGLHVTGMIAMPSVSRGNRNFENYYVNGRYVKSRILRLAIEDGYGNKLMQHQYPFTCLFLSVDGSKVDVNVHPTKMEVRFSNEQAVYAGVKAIIERTLAAQEMIIRTELHPPLKIQTERKPLSEKDAAGKDPQVQEAGGIPAAGTVCMPQPEKKPYVPEPFEKEARRETEIVQDETVRYEQETLPTGFLAEGAKGKRRILGQIFSTYWIVEYEDNLFIIDQHAAHEKVLYEKLIREYHDRRITSQNISPPVIISLDVNEETLLKEHRDAFAGLGFEIEPFGGHEYAVSAVPYTLEALGAKQLFCDMLDHLEDEKKAEGLELYTHRVATEACKAAVKGNGRLSTAEAEHLIDELLTLDDPYHCPHGRPTIVAISRTELEKMFKRIVS